ncbi:MAG: hypothetical protein EAY81_04725 [Bacteroidetes bacterium]|nr:MAG: hypothetical protein EAY81_04725 [Bacteroidota bacterium]
MTKIQSFLKQLDGTVSNKGFALFRITFALFLLAFISHITYYRPLIFNTIPVLAPNPFPAKLFLSIWLVAVAGLLVGWQTRIAAIVNYIFVVLAAFSFSNSGSGSFNDDLLRIGSFLLIIMPVQKAWSIDVVTYTLSYGVRPAAQTSKLNYLGAVFVSLGLMYWASSLTKLYSPMWSKGMGLWIPAVMPYNKWHGISFYLNQKWLMMAANYFTVIWEMLFLFFLFTNKWRHYFLLAGVFFHLVIAAIFPFPLLCFGPIPFYLLFIPDSFWLKFSPKPLLIGLNPNDKRHVFFARVLTGLHAATQLSYNNTGKLLINNQAFNSNWQAVTFALKTTFVGRLLGWLVTIELIKLLALAVANRFIQFEGSNKHPVQLLTETFKRQAFLVFCVTLFCVQAFYSSYHLVSRINGGVTVEGMKKYYHIRKDITDFSLKPSNLFRTLFGLNARGVFLDHSNMGTKTVFAITHTDKNGNKTWLPYFNEKGYCLGLNMNLAWSKYSFNSVCSGTIPNPMELEKTLWFWADRYHIKLDSLDLEVVKRTYQFPEHFEYNYHQKLVNQPWLPEGKVMWRKGKYYYHPIDTL